MASAEMPRKRKRQEDAAAADELEIDLSLPEPLSKKAARHAKKAKNPTKPAKSAAAAADHDADSDSTSPAAEEKKPPRRSEWAIWIGNLPWTTTKLALRAFLREQAGIDEARITRLHMPAPTTTTAQRGPEQQEKPRNKGFAYVDFATAADLQAALAVSERALGGRRVLVKDARSFEGRPVVAPAADPVAADGSAAGGAAAAAAAGSSRDKPPSKRVFVGNLAFDVTKDDLERHFSQCGELVDVFLATFEDSGKCKGFAWVTFAEVAAAAAAVRGWINREREDAAEDGGAEDDGEQGKGAKKRLRPRKWMVNKLAGRVLRCEFAEDPALRYRKRFGKKKDAAAAKGSDDADTDRLPPPLPAAAAGDELAGDAAARKKKQSAAHERRRTKRKTELRAET